MKTNQNQPPELNEDFSAYSRALGDWRLSTAIWVSAIDGATLERPLQATQITSFHSKEIEVSFPTPSAAALHLNSAWRAAKRACELRRGLLGKVQHPKGGPLILSFENDAAGQLFEFFEEMMSVVSCSCSAVEAFCNRTIVDEAKGEILVKKKKEHVPLSAEDVVRFATLDDKVKRIVPDLLNVATPAGKAVYQKFIKWKNLRDSITHFKRHDEARIHGKLHEHTVFSTLFFSNEFAITEEAMELIRYFKPDDLSPRWLKNPEWVRPEDTTYRDITEDAI